jgi:OOP family OmpA-OmpF porin
MGSKIKFLAAAVIMSGAMTSVYADDDSAIYVGLMAGRTNTHNIPRNVQVSATPPTTVYANPSNNGMGGRIFMGYSFNRYAALEAGYAHYASSNYNVPLASCGEPAIRENAVDFVGKGTVPFSQFGVFGKAGVAIIRTTLSGSLASSTVLSSCNSNGTTNTVRPEIGIGASYMISPNWVTDISWTRILKGSQVQNADLVALGLTYRVVDNKCGQFVC